MVTDRIVPQHFTFDKDHPQYLKSVFCALEEQTKQKQTLLGFTQRFLSVLLAILARKKPNLFLELQ